MGVAQVHMLGLVGSGHHNFPRGIVESPLHLRPRLALEHRREESMDSGDELRDGGGARMLAILQHEQVVLGARHVVVVVVAVVHLKEFVVSGGADQLGNVGDPVPVHVRIDDSRELCHVGVIEACSEVERVVVLERECPPSQVAIEMVDVVKKVQRIHHDRNHSNHALVHSCHGPSGPSAFACTGHDELGDRVTFTDQAFLGGKINGSIKGTNDCFRHWQAQQPVRLIWLLKEVLPCPSNQCVLAATMFFRLSGELARLERDLKESDTNRPASHSKRHNQGNILILCIRWDMAVSTAPGRIDQGGISVLEVVRDDNNHQMPPQGTVDICLSEPALTGHIEDVGRPAKADFLLQLRRGEVNAGVHILVIRVRSIHVHIKRGVVVCLHMQGENQRQ
mmetsp:Transcript_1384/g.3051  ORF Transcript_1384/g.3051 Transcript_1384/m.3051 type:complete len:394 (+) Transcript_1384:428-1609(+)